MNIRNNFAELLQVSRFFCIFAAKTEEDEEVFIDARSRHDGYNEHFGAVS